MEREILTHPLTPQQLRAEFEYVIAYLTAIEIEECSVLFASAWGIESHPGGEGKEDRVQVEDLSRMVAEAESADRGELGHDDLFIRAADVEFRFCNDCDVHIHFNASSALVEEFFERWGRLGYRPAEWLKTQEHGPGERVRAYGPDGLHERMPWRRRGRPRRSPRKKRAIGLCLFFSSFACLVSVLVWWTTEDLDLIDHVIMWGSPIVLGVVSYLMGFHVSDDADGA